MRDDTGTRVVTLLVVAAMVTSTFATAAVASGVTSTDGTSAALAGGGAGVSADIPGAVPPSDDQYAVRQGDSCEVIEPLGDGSQSVEEFYDYRINVSGAFYGSLGTVDLQANQKSQFFVYDGTNGTSLVFLHDKMNGSYGGTVEMSFTGLPENGSWVVQDDDYPNRDDEFITNGTQSDVLWLWDGDRNDGGAFSALDSSFEQITINPAFNEESSQYPSDAWFEPISNNQIDEWFVRTGTGENVTLEMDQPVSIEPGTCDDSAPTAELTASDTDVTTSDSVSFDARGSSDDGEIIEYQWDFDGDDTVELTTDDPTVEYTYSQGGAFEATVTVIDEGRNDDAASVPISVEAVARQVDGCEVIDSPGTYNLTSDVENSSSGSCIDIASDNVTLNGNGHTITDTGSDNRSVGVGIGPETANVVVRDVTVEGWTVGVEMNNAENVRLSEIAAQDNLYGTFAIRSNGITITDSWSNSRAENSGSIAFSHNQATNVTHRNTTAYGSAYGFHFERESTNVSLTDVTAYDNTVGQGDYYHFPNGYDGPMNTEVDNMTVDGVSFGFTGGRGATFSGTNISSAPEDVAGTGESLAYFPVHENPTLDSLTISYSDESVEGLDESSLTMWQYSWDRGGDRADGEWEQVGDSLDTDANTVTATDLQPQEIRYVFALFADAPEDGTPEPDGTPTAVIDAPASVTANESVTFDASGSTDNGTIESYEWQFGDGETATGETVDHTYAEPGEYTVELTVTDDQGNTNTTTTEVTVEPADDGETDEAPTAAIDAPSSATAGEELTLDASGSTDDGTIESYEWDLGDGETDSGETIEHVYEEPGEYEVTLTVTDDAGNTDTATAELTVAENQTDEPPVPVIDAPASVTANESASFDASESTDDGTIESYEWQFGDGETATGETVDHAYTDTGEYEVTLTVTDDAGNTNTTSRTVTVTVPNTPPNATFTLPETASAGESVTLDASESADENGIIEYRWDVDGDGAIDAVTDDPTVDHAFTTAGNVTVTLGVVDGSGTVATTNRSITVTDDEAPTAAVNVGAPDEVTTNTSVVFSAVDSTDNAGIAGYEWTFGDNETATGTVVQHTYAEPGEYEVTLTVTDESGNTATSSTQVVVDAGDPNATRPTAALDVPESVPAGEQVTLNASESDADGGISEYRWDVDGDGEVDATTSGSAVGQTYSEAGNVSIVVRVVDANGSTAVAIETIEVGGGDDPVAVLDGPTSATVDESVDFSAANATDDGTIESYEWQFGDGETATGETVDHAYTDTGEYEVTLTVTDDAGNTDTATRDVTVEAARDGDDDGGGGGAPPGGGGGGDDDDDDDGGGGAPPGGGDGGDDDDDDDNAGGGGGADDSDDDEEETETPTPTDTPTPAPQPADVSVTALDANRTNVASGQPIELVATLENAGDETGSYTAELELFGEVVAERTVDVPGGETVTVSFVQSIDAAGTYTARVGQETVTLTVGEAAAGGQTATAEVTETTTPGFGPVAVVLAALVALAGYALGARRRGGER